MPVLAVRNQVVGEGDAYVDVVVALSEAAVLPVTVRYSSGDWTAMDGDAGDYLGIDGTLTFVPGQTVHFVRIGLRFIQATAGSDVEPLECFRFQLSNPVNATLDGEGFAWITVVDNDTLVNVPELFVHDAVANEAASSVSFGVSLGALYGQSTNRPVTVDYQTVDGSAKAGSDYVAHSGQLTFLPGESVKTVTVDLIDDALTEPDETFSLRLANPTVATIVDGQGRALIGANDTVPHFQPTITSVGTVVTEESGWAEIVVQLGTPGERTVSVRYETQDDSAGRADFLAVDGTLVFLPGQTVQVLRVDILSDSVAEVPERFRVDFSGAINATLAVESVTVDVVDARNAVGPNLSRGNSDDLYRVDAAGIGIFEAIGGGIDTVVTVVDDFVLPDNVENLVILAPAATGSGNASNNVFVGDALDNVFDGKGGADTMVFRSAASDNLIGGSPTLRSVTSSAEGKDTLVSVERLQFSDVVLASDTHPGEVTFDVMALFNAGFDRLPTRDEWSHWVHEFDLLGNPVAQAQAMINAYAPGISDQELVSHLWSMVVGAPITTAALMDFSELLRDGTYTQASLLDIAANHSLNVEELVEVVGTTVTLDAAAFPIPGA